MSALDKLKLTLETATYLTLNNTFWYFVSACSAWVAFYIVLRRLLIHRRISDKSPKAAQVSREILHSLRSLFVFGFVAGFVVYSALSGWTKMYGNIHDYGWSWLVLSIVVMIGLHDAYFYWTHRVMHHRWLYRRIHRTHHLSTSPTPWADYAFSPIEALVQAGIAPLFVFTLPVHPVALSIFMLWQIVFNVLGHNGYEIFPQWFLKTPLGQFLNSPTHHAMHHEAFRANFSLYFNIWDLLMGTKHPNYEQRFQKTFARSPNSEERSMVVSAPGVASDKKLLSRAP